MSFKRMKSVPVIHKIIWWVVRAILLIWGLDGFFHGEPVNLLQAFIGIAFSFLWSFLQLFTNENFAKRLKYFPQTVLNVFIVFGFVFNGRINFYTAFPAYDLTLHFISGYIAAWFAYDLAFLIQGEKRRLSFLLASLFSLSFSMAVACGWEIYEFSIDRILGLNMQLSEPYSDIGLIDTMYDLICGVSGGFFGMLYSTLSRSGIIGTGRNRVRKKLVKEEPQSMP